MLLINWHIVARLRLAILDEAHDLLEIESFPQALSLNGLLLRLYRLVGLDFKFELSKLVLAVLEEYSLLFELRGGFFGFCEVLNAVCVCFVYFVELDVETHDVELLFVDASFVEKPLLVEVK